VPAAGAFNSGQAFLSNTGNDPWWQVDLDNTYSIKNIVIWNRTDGFAERLNDAIVEILDENDLVIYSYNIGTAGRKNTIDVPFVSGQKVRVRKEGISIKINIAEVQVFVTTEPTLAARVEKNTCTNGTSNDDAYLAIDEISIGDKYGYSMGYTYTGPDYASATSVSGLSFPIVIEDIIANSDTTTNYVVRVYNGEECFIETLLTLDSDPCDLENDACVELNIQAYLEGSYKPDINQMTTELNTGRGLLPGQTPSSGLANSTPPGQPYHTAPWNYTGTEGENWTDADYTNDDVDWVLVSFRTGASKSTEVVATAAILDKYGNINFPNRCALSTNLGNAFYIVVQHRNHIGVMSPLPISINNGILSHDFRTSDSYHDPTSFGQKQTSTG